MNLKQPQFNLSSRTGVNITRISKWEQITGDLFNLASWSSTYFRLDEQRKEGNLGKQGNTR